MKLLKKTKVFAIIFYVLAAIYCLYTIFSIVTTITYLSSVASSGMYMDVRFSDMLNAFLSTVGPNLFYTLVYFFCGYIIQLVSGDIIPEDQEFEEHMESTTPSAETTTEEEPETAISYETINEPAAAVELETVTEEPSEVENVVATIADIESEVEIAAPEEVVALPEETEELLLEDNSTQPDDDKVEEFEEKIAEDLDLIEPANQELEELETEDEEE